jgi:hypothetical protein
LEVRVGLEGRRHLTAQIHRQIREANAGQKDVTACSEAGGEL